MDQHLVRRVALRPAYAVDLVGSEDAGLQVRLEGTKVPFRADGIRIVRVDSSAELQVFGVSQDGSMRGHLDAGAAAWPVVFFAATGEVISRPMFTSVDVASGTADASEIAINARFDEELAAGEFDLSIKPFAKRTIVEVSARVTLRRAVGSIGIAPLSTMFLFSKGSHYGSDDFRAGVHDSDGLWIRSAAARVTWRSLNNPPLTANSYFSQRDPAAFGFVQRDRAFESYQDQHTAYQDRPSLVASPSEGWGDGFVRLVETPSSSDSSANIMATWMPRAPIRTNAQAEWQYKLEWSAFTGATPEVAVAHRLAIGVGGVAGVQNSDLLRKFVVDFKGPALEPQNLPAGPLDAYVSVSPGTVEHVSIFAVDEPGTIRLAIDASIETTDPVELRAYLIAGGRQLTETWSTSGELNLRTETDGQRLSVSLVSVRTTLQGPRLSS